MKVTIEKINDPAMIDSLFKGLPGNHKQIMMDAYRTSYAIWLGLADDKVACVWGVTLPTLMSDRAYIWLWNTDIVKGYPFTFIRRTQIVIRDLLKEYKEVTGAVNALGPGATSSVRWLKMLGAKFGDVTEKGFIPFSIRRENGPN